MVNGGEVEVLLLLKDKMTAALSKAQSNLNKFGGGMTKLGTGMQSLGNGMTMTGVGLTTLTAGAVAGVMGLAKIGEASLVAEKRLLNITKSMDLFGNNAGIVNDRLLKLADTQSRQLGIDDDIIKNTMSKLMTFKELAATADDVGGSFDRATMAAINMAAAGFGDAEGNAIQLGKALNDPIKGITALNRSGITFTETEKEMIAEMVNSGKILEAQDYMLKAVEKQVGGTAAATATASGKMKVAWDEMWESLGIKMLPAFDRFGKVMIEKIIPAFEKIISKVDVDKLFTTIGDTLEDVVLPALEKLFTKIEDGLEWYNKQDDATKEWIAKAIMLVAALGPVLMVLGPIISSLGTLLIIIPQISAAFGGLTLAAAAPVAALVALIAAAALLYKNWDTILPELEKVGTSLGDAWYETGQKIKTTFQNIVQWVKDLAVKFTTPFVKIGNAVGRFVANIKRWFDQIKKFGQGIINAPINFVNSAASALGFNIPGYADGGVIAPNSPQLIMVGDNKREREIIAPESAMKQAFIDALSTVGGVGGNGETIIYVRTDREFDKVMRELKDAKLGLKVR